MHTLDDNAFALQSCTCLVLLYSIYETNTATFFFSFDKENDIDVQKTFLEQFVNSKDTRKHRAL